jgi:hypothetical protein
MKFIPLRAVSLSVLFLASACVAAAQPGRIAYRGASAGQGNAHSRYATGGLAREEVAARLAGLDTEVERLKKALTGK